jgi:hypothetical protein
MSKLTKVRVGTHERRDKIVWIQAMIRKPERIVYWVTKKGFKHLTYVYLENEELLMYRLMFKK